MTNLDSVLKSRNITLPRKFCPVKAMVFPAVIYGCESWTIKKAEHQRSFWTVVLEKILESPLDSKEIQPVHPKGDQSWIFIGRTELKLKLQYFGHLTWTADSLEKILMLGKIEGKRRSENRGWDGWMASPIQWTWVRASSRSWWWTGKHGMLQSMGRKESDTTEQLNWTEGRHSAWRKAFVYFLVFENYFIH